MHSGRSCRDLVAAISDYIDGELTAPRCRDLEAHLAECPCCDRFTDSLRRAVAVCRSAGTTRLPGVVQRRARARIADLLKELPLSSTPCHTPAKAGAKAAPRRGREHSAAAPRRAAKVTKTARGTRAR